MRALPPRLTKFGAALSVSILVAAGRWVRLSGTAESAPVELLLLSLGCALPAFGVAAFITDLVLARGLLQRKILYIEILGAALAAVGILGAAAAADSIPPAAAEVVTVAGAAVGAAALFLVLLVLDRRDRLRPDYRLNKGERLPNKYLQARPLKTLMETLFRLFPAPEPVGLYALGSPADDSPLFVTGNFELTVRRVARALRGLNCRLLVCDSRGVNLWCSSLAGHFGTDKIVRAIRDTGLAERSRCRQLILPQLCASAVSLEQLEAQTGFRGSFGPLHIRDIRRYLQAPQDTGIRSAAFPLRERIEMAIGSPLILTGLLLLLFNFLGLGHLALLLPALYCFAFLHALIFPYRPLRNIGAWAAACGAVALLLQGLFCLWLFPERLVLCALTVGLGAAYLVSEFSGWSPLARYSLIPQPQPRVRVDAERCTGCRRCIEVCPKALFQMRGGISTAAAGQCVSCRSCFSQCPAGAIRHSLQERLKVDTPALKSRQG